MIGRDDEYTDLVAVLALGALPEAEARRVAAHLTTCEGCRTLYAELRPVADLVGVSAENATLDELASTRMKSRIMREVRGGAGAIPERRSMSLGWFAAAAAALVAVVIGAENVSLRDRAAQSVAEQRAQLIAERTQLDEQRTRLADLQGRQRALEARLIAVVAPGGRHYAIPQGEIVTNAGKLFVAVELAALPSGKVYQAWTIAKGATAIKPSVTFSPGPSGVAIVALPVDAAGIAAVAVSVEPAGGSKAPTTTPKFIRKLS